MAAGRVPIVTVDTILVSPGVAMYLNRLHRTVRQKEKEAGGVVRSDEVAAFWEAVDAVSERTRAALEEARRARSECADTGIPNVYPRRKIVSLVEEDQPLTLSTADVADLLGCEQRNVTALAQRGSLPGVKQHGRWTFDQLEVDAYLERREGKTA